MITLPILTKISLTIKKIDMEKYSVNASSLNIRSTASKENNLNIIGRIARNSIVEVISKTSSDWWKVRSVSQNIEGYVYSSFLSLIGENSEVFNTIVRVDYPQNPRASLNSKMKMDSPIGDSTIPFRDVTDTNSKLSTLGQLISKLNVSSSIRYQKTEKHTFCNIYAYDYCYFAKAYIPRVWWTSSSIKKLLNNENVEVNANNVREMRANDLHDWMLNWSDEFNWQRTFDLDELQQKVNLGVVGIICAKRKDTSLSGHIVVVVPENDSNKAVRHNNKVIYPLQSQAGSNNYNYFSLIKKNWWLGNQFSSFVFYYHL